MTSTKRGMQLFCITALTGDTNVILGTKISLFGFMFNNLKLKNNAADPDWHVTTLFDPVKLSNFSNFFEYFPELDSQF